MGCWGNRCFQGTGGCLFTIPIKLALGLLYFFDIATDIMVVIGYLTTDNCEVSSNKTIEHDGRAREVDEIVLNYRTYGCLYLILSFLSHVIQGYYCYRFWTEIIPSKARKFSFVLLHMPCWYYKELEYILKANYEQNVGRNIDERKRNWENFVKIEHEGQFLSNIEKGFEAFPQLIIIMYVFSLERCRGCPESMFYFDAPFQLPYEFPVEYKMVLSFLSIVVPQVLDWNTSKMKEDKMEEWSILTKIKAYIPIGIWYLLSIAVKILLITGLIIIHPAFTCIYFVLRIGIGTILTRKYYIISKRKAVTYNLLWFTMVYQSPSGETRVPGVQKKNLILCHFVLSSLECMFGLFILFLQTDVKCSTSWLALLHLEDFPFFYVLIIIFAAHFVAWIFCWIFYRCVHPTAYRRIAYSDADEKRDDMALESRA